jgi:AsmA protein
LNRILKWIGIAFAALILVVISLPFLINVDEFRPTLQSDLTTALGRQVTLGNLHLKILTAEVTADDLSVAEDLAFGKPAFLRAKAMRVGVEILPFVFSRKLVVTDLLLDQPEIDLVQTPSGDWNFSTLGGKSAGKSNAAAAPVPSSGRMPLDLSVKLVKVSNGRLTLSRTVGHWKPVVLEQANLELRDFSATSAFPFTVAARVRGGGSLQLNGKAGPINPADSSMTPLNITLKATQLDLAGSGLNDFAPNVTGLMSFDGSGDSDGVTLSLTGKVKGEKLKLARNGTPATRPLELDFSVRHDLRKHLGTVRQGDVHIGATVAHLTGTYAEHGESMTLAMKFSGPDMPVQELESLLPALGIALPAGTSLRGGSATANFSMEGPADRLVVAGSVALNNTMLTGFDLSRKMGPIERLAGIKAGPDTEIQLLSVTMRSAPEGTDAQDLKLVVPAIGEVSGAGSVSPANELKFKMSAIVHATGLLAMVGNKPIPFAIEGTSSDPVFKPDIAAV